MKPSSLKEGTSIISVITILFEVHYFLYHYFYITQMITESWNKIINIYQSNL